MPNLSTLLDGVPMPVFIKANDSYGSVGLAADSRCQTTDEVEKTCRRMFQSWETIIVEEFIDGDEFTVLLLGDYTMPDNMLVLRPAHRKFAPTSKTSWITYETNWTSEADQDEFFNYVLYVGDDCKETEAIAMDLGKRAFIACKGTGYARVDLRRSNATKEMFVLEVNALPGLGAESSSDNVLRLQGSDSCEFVHLILGHNTIHIRSE
jgi:D-alanine-D-alanine ligase-like ATP-grasp enzyme